MTNVDDENPAWTTVPADTNVDENVAVGTSIFTVAASDDTSVLTYSIQSVSGGNYLLHYSTQHIFASSHQHHL